LAYHHEFGSTAVKFALLPVVILAVSAAFTWATARYLEAAHQQRATAAAQPRSRPYATTLPKSLTGS
jgi:hypothetical protein